MALALLGGARSAGAAAPVRRPRLLVAAGQAATDPPTRDTIARLSEEKASADVSRSGSSNTEQRIVRF